MGSVKDRFLYFTFDLGSFSGPFSMSQITERLNTVWNSGFRPHFASASLKLNYLRIPLRDLLQYGMSTLCWSLLHPPKVSGKNSFSLPPFSFPLLPSPLLESQASSLERSQTFLKVLSKGDSTKSLQSSTPFSISQHTHKIFFHTVFKEENK